MSKTPPTETPELDDAQHKARMLMSMLDEETRQKVLARMSDDARQRVMQAMQQQERPGAAFSASIAERRRAMREAVVGVNERKINEATQQVAEAVDPVRQTEDAQDSPQDQPVAARRAIDPLDRLREVHPAALAKAMQGERVEAWALVLGRLKDSPQEQALLAYVDPQTRQAIFSTQSQQATLPAALRSTAERAIGQTVVPRALAEHQRIIQSALRTAPTY